MLRTLEGRRQSLLGALPARRAKEAAMRENERRGPGVRNGIWASDQAHSMDWRRSGLAGRKGTCEDEDEVALHFGGHVLASCPVISYNMIGFLDPPILHSLPMGLVVLQFSPHPFCRYSQAVRCHDISSFRQAHFLPDLSSSCLRPPRKCLRIEKLFLSPINEFDFYLHHFPLACPPWRLLFRRRRSCSVVV